MVNLTSIAKETSTKACQQLGMQWICPDHRVEVRSHLKCELTVLQAGGQQYSPSQIGAFTLTKMKETAGESSRFKQDLARACMLVAL